MKLSLSHWYPGSVVMLDFIDSGSLPFSYFKYCQILMPQILSGLQYIRKWIRILNEQNDMLINCKWENSLQRYIFLYLEYIFIFQNLKC